LTGVDLAARCVSATGVDGQQFTEPYDALVIATGVSNGFWRRATLQSPAQIAADLRDTHTRLASAASVIVVGGGAAAVSSAANLARTWPDKRIELYFPGPRALSAHHPRIWDSIQGRLTALGVKLHSGHRAAVPPGFGCDEITGGPVSWSTGQPPACADAVLWAIGRVRPNTDWLPAELLDERGFVRVTPQLRVPDHPGVFAVGDVRAELAGRPLRSFRAATRRWGSVLGVQPEGLEVFTPTGQAFRFPAWSIDRVLMPWIVRRGIYRGIRAHQLYGGDHEIS
jgi:NADH dehydrogenase FAD-containing subunit